MKYSIKKTNRGIAYARLQGLSSHVKPPLVLIRGLARNMCHWMGFEELLADEYDVLLVDNRGFGYSSGVPINWTDTVGDYASDVLEVLDQESINQAVMFGISLGGMISLRFAQLFPNRCLGAVAANSSSGGQAQTLRLTPKGLVAFLKCVPSPKKSEEILSKVMVANSEEERPEIVRVWNDIKSKHKRSNIKTIKQLAAALRFNQIQTLKNIEVPVTILSGDQDHLVSSENSRILHQAIPHSKYVVIRGGGHELAQNKGKEIADEMLKFKEEHL